MKKKKVGKKEKISAAEKAITALELPQEIILGIPSINILLGRECTIENCVGIIEYDSGKITVGTKEGICTFCGENLEISSLTDDETDIRGKITSLEISYTDR